MRPSASFLTQKGNGKGKPMKTLRIILTIVLLFLIWQMGLPARAAENGDRVVVWLPQSSAALSSQVKNGNLAGTTVGAEGETVTGFSEAEVWILEETEAGWRFLQQGQALSVSAGSYNLRLGVEYDCWRLEAVEDGYLVQNTGSGNYLRWNGSWGYWTTAARGTAVKLYLLPTEEDPEPSDPEETTEPTAPADVPALPVPEGYTLYFGQLHAHTDLSDGTGSVEEAFAYASQVPGLDFFAVTDHSQTFDYAREPSLTEDAARISQAWARGKAAAESVTDGEFVGIFGFEMTWNQGQGHISTFNTPGFLSREQDAYQSYASGMEAYYDALLEAAGSVSQFNHPGDGDGDFKDFSGYSPVLDNRITLIEVGGGTAGYDRALALGWHLAPTHNQNNHAGHWGDETDARTVVLAPELTEQAIYDALADYRVYATSDGDLEIVYTLNGHLLGSRIPMAEMGETVTITADLRDPTDPVGTVAVVTEGGTVLAEDTLSGSRGSLSVTLPADRAYYYLRITQEDGDLAVTAPVWLDAQSDLGISALKTASEMTTAGEAQTLVLELFNDEDFPWQITSVTITAGGQAYEVPLPGTLAPYTTAAVTVPHTFPMDGISTVTAEVAGEFAGQSRAYSRQLQVTVMPPPLVDDVIIDFTHGTGEAFEKAMALARAGDVDMRPETGEITPEMLKKCRILILPAPERDWRDGFVDHVKDYVNQGGNLILLGTAAGENPQAAARLNGLLEALGLTLRANGDDAVDANNNGGTPDQLHTTCFSDSPWLEAVTEGQHYAQYAGCSVTGGSWLVKAMDGETVLMAAEETEKGGWVFLSGGAFLADVHLDNTSNGWALPTANQTILETILDVTHAHQEIIPLESLRRAERGRIYLAEGRITAGTHNPNTAFENTIYIQDDTGAIALQPYSAHGLALGTRVRVLGSLESDGENPVLNLLRLEVLEKDDPVKPQAAGSLDYTLQGAQLLKLEGSVVSAEPTADGLGIHRLVLETADGSHTAVLVEPNIRSGSRGKNELARIVKPGNRICAVGLVHLAEGETVLRIRDCDEVTLLWSPDWEDPDGEDGGDIAEPDINPDTGDRSGIAGYGALALLSLLGLAVLRRKP